MAKSKSPLSVRSLKDLDQLIPKTRLSPENGRRSSETDRPPLPVAPPAPHEEAALFRAAMEDVQPLEQHTVPLNPKPAHTELSSLDGGAANDRTEGVEALRALVYQGKNFVVEYTSEYIEGRGYQVPPEVTRRLHRGRFAVQDHLDLHGHSAASAQGALESFFRGALGNGKTSLLIVHGRGRSSTGRPVLKSMVQNWLRRGPFRKHLVAFASARPCDGGTGATYVLLRHRPLTRRHRKNGKFKLT